MPQVICKDIYDKEYKIDSEKLSFRPSVYGILIRDNKILLVKQFGDGYDFPGGGIEKNETIIEALRREFWEETGLKIKEKELVDCQSSFFKMPNGGHYYNSILLYYNCYKINGKLSIANFDKWEKINSEMPEWIDLDKIDKIKFYNSVDSLALIKKAIEIKRK